MLNNTLLGISSGSFGAWLILKKISLFCATILPITGVLSFLIYLIITIINLKKNK